MLWLVENTEWYLETYIYSPPKTKELLCPVLEKGRWIAKHSLKTLFQAANKEKEKIKIIRVLCPAFVLVFWIAVLHTMLQLTEHLERGYEWAIPYLIQWCTVHESHVRYCHSDIKIIQILHHCSLKLFCYVQLHAWENNRMFRGFINVFTGG